MSGIIQGMFRSLQNIKKHDLGASGNHPENFRNLNENDQKMTEMITSILKFSMLAHVWRGARGHYSFYIHIDS